MKGGNASIFFQQLKNELKKHDLIELYDNSINKIAEPEENEEDFFNEEEQKSDDYQNYIDGNIIQIHIPTGKNMNRVFTTTKDYIYKYNDLILSGRINNEFEIMKRNAKQLIQYFIKEKKLKESLTKKEKENYDSLYNQSNEFTKYLQKSCSILYHLDILNVKSKKNVMEVAAGATVVNAILGFFSVFTFGITFALAIIVGFGVFLFARKNVIHHAALKYGFGEKDIEEYELEKYFNKKEESDEKLDEKFQKKIEAFFMDLLYYIGPIQCAIKSKESLLQIYELFTILSKKKEDDWNNFKVEKI